MYLQKNGVDLVSILQTEGNEAVILAIFSTFSLSKMMISVMCILSFIFLATTIDSTAYVLSLITTKGNCDKEPGALIRGMWAMVIFTLAIGLSAVGGLALIQKLAIIVAFPLIFVIVCLMIVSIKVLKEQFTTKS